LDVIEIGRVQYRAFVDLVRESLGLDASSNLQHGAPHRELDYCPRRLETDDEDFSGDQPAAARDRPRQHCFKIGKSHDAVDELLLAAPNERRRQAHMCSGDVNEFGVPQVGGAWRSNAV
jgi:hypothetical protein